MGIMSVQLQALIKQADRSQDHEALIVAIDLTEKDDSARSIYAIDLITGYHGWFHRSEIRNKVRADMDRARARQKDISDLEGQFRAEPVTGPGPGNNPLAVQPARPGGSDDLPDGAREIISGITDRLKLPPEPDPLETLPEPERYRLRKRRRKPPAGPKGS